METNEELEKRIEESREAFDKWVASIDDMAFSRYIWEYVKGRKLLKEEELLLEEELRKEPLNWSWILDTMAKEEKKTLVKYLQSGHFIDQKLISRYGRGKKMDVKDIVTQTTKEAIKNEEVKVEGVRLSEKEEQTLNGILMLLHEKSDTRKNSKNKPIDNRTYYKGNLPAPMVPYGDYYTEAPTIRFKAPELYEAVTGSNSPSLREINYIKGAIWNLADKKFLLIYNRSYKQGRATKTDRVEAYQPLIMNILTSYKALTNKELEAVDAGNEDIKTQKGEVILTLNPLFIDQIDTKFIEVPTEINSLTREARGGGRVHSGITKLRDHLLRAISYQKNKGADKTYVNKEKLPSLLGLDKYVKEGRKKLINTRIEESIEACKELNLITEVKVIKGAKGQEKYEFTLNRDY
jgi:hypothetical protein